MVIIERIAPHTNFGGVRCGSFGLAIFTDLFETGVPGPSGVNDQTTPALADPLHLFERFDYSKELIF